MHNSHKFTWIPIIKIFLNILYYNILKENNPHQECNKVICLHITARPLDSNLDILFLDGRHYCLINAWTQSRNDMYRICFLLNMPFANQIHFIVNTNNVSNPFSIENWIRYKPVLGVRDVALYIYLLRIYLINPSLTFSFLYFGLVAFEVSTFSRILIKEWPQWIKEQTRNFK